MIKKYIVCDEATTIGATLWCVFTWFIEVAEVAPIANITAPEKRCGKTQLLAIFGRLSKKPLIASNISPAAMFRAIEKYRPTLLIDEADAFLKRDNDELRGVINSGHTRSSAFVIRTVGDHHEPCRFSTWGAKAIAGIGSLSDTLKDRSIILKLRRKLPTESVEKLRYANPQMFDDLASMMARFAEDYKDTFQTLRPHIPETLNDRAGDNWYPLLAIADLSGEKWSLAARQAAMALSAETEDGADDSASQELLMDIKEVFDTTKEESITTVDLVKYLSEDKTKRWATYNKGEPITPRQLGNRLKLFDITSATIYCATTKKLKGYHRKDFDDAFARYLPATHSEQ